MTDWKLVGVRKVIILGRNIGMVDSALRGSCWIKGDLMKKDLDKG